MARHVASMARQELGARQGPIERRKALEEHILAPRDPAIVKGGPRAYLSRQAPDVSWHGMEGLGSPRPAGGMSRDHRPVSLARAGSDGCPDLCCDAGQIHARPIRSQSDRLTRIQTTTGLDPAWKRRRSRRSSRGRGRKIDRSG
jgi:hypothetical protein